MGFTRAAAAAALIAALAACQADGPGLLQAREAPAAAEGPAPITPEGDVEAPEVYEDTAEGIWDGRPSLGGVWVAHPGVGDPQRVLIRAADRQVVGALFRRERQSAGPPYQISSQAATALGIPPGAARDLRVVALRQPPAPEPETEAIVSVPEGIAAAAEAETAARAEAAGPPPERPVVQIAVYPQRAPARAAMRGLEGAGVPARLDVLRQGRTRLWRVSAGPARDVAARDALLARVRALGYPAALAIER